MKIDERLKKLGKTINTDCYKVIFKDGTDKHLSSLQLLKFSIVVAREETIHKVEKTGSLQTEESESFLNLCRAIMAV
jgi:hypothetical protein